MSEANLWLLLCGALGLLVAWAQHAAERRETPRSVTTVTTVGVVAAAALCASAEGQWLSAGGAVLLPYVTLRLVLGRGHRSSE
ncbi:hypothetical protein H1Q78_19295 [Cellulosimicrobium cellulans]|uniref:hypothetical protein n=1 Tax=Cellulosimicrobium cellulans TaxID=1710 RepID=UPI001EDA76E2|nr:hypothetical protein [Cellulosimicrobium cellulans]UKJ63715.1 hypothetical protein H1Q78_19295 [Cellulosimicrobium cellulans]